MTQIGAITKISHHKHDWAALACQQAHWPNSTEPPQLCSISPGLGGSAGAWCPTQRCSPSSPQSSRDYREGEYMPNRPDLLPIPWPWPSLNPFSFSFLSKSLFLSICYSPSPGWLFLLLSLCPNMRLPLLTSSQALSSLFFSLSFSFKILGCCWAVEVCRSRAGLKGTELRAEQHCSEDSTDVNTVITL